MKRYPLTKEKQKHSVAPFTGAGIETVLRIWLKRPLLVAPFTGAGIETNMARASASAAAVAPFTGAGIETEYHDRRRNRLGLPPSRGQELKLLAAIFSAAIRPGCPLHGGRN